MFQICIDNDGYYAEGMTENLVEVEYIPDVEDTSYLPAYRYNSITQRLILDEERLKSINDSLNRENSIPTDSERLEAVEAAVAEMAEYIYGGGA